MVGRFIIQTNITMKRYNNLQRYLTGMGIGICLEYLHRVEILIYPIVIAICLIITIIIDIIESK